MAKKVRNLAVYDPDGNFVKGIILLAGQEPEDAGEEIPPGCTYKEVDDFPKPKQDDRLERITRMRSGKREEFADIIKGEIQDWLLNEVIPELFPGTQLTKEQIARLFPLAGKKGT